MKTFPWRQVNQLRGSNGSARRHSAAKRSRRAHLRIEWLEDRVVMSAFTPGDLVVYRAGDSTHNVGTSGSTAVPIYLDEYTPSGVFVQSIELTTGTGGNGTVGNPTPDYTDSGKATNDGSMTLGPDGQYLASVGYDVGVGSASITKNYPTGTIAVVGNNGVPTLSTNMNDNSGSSSIGMNNRGATYDATNQKLYETGVVGLFEAPLASGTGAPGTFSSIQGVASPSSAQISFDEVAIFGGHTFADDSSGIYDFGPGPTTTTAGTLLAGVDTGTSKVVVDGLGDKYSAGSASNFFFANLGSGANWNGTGFDTVYVVDNQSAYGAILKYSYNGSTWTSEGGVVAPDQTGVSGSGAYIMGITGTYNTGAKTANLYFTEGSQGTGAVSDVFSLTDTGGLTGLIYNASPVQIALTQAGSGATALGTGSVAATNASVYETFRGIAFAPTATALAIGGLNGASFTSGGNPVFLAGGSGTFADTLTSSQLNGSTLSIAITAHGDNAHDSLDINNQSGTQNIITTSGSNVQYTYAQGTAVTIGTFSGGTGGTALTITFNGSATATAVQALINQINFYTTDTATTENPAPARTVQFTFTPSTGNGSAVSASETVNILPVGTPFINPGSPITRAENTGAYAPSANVTGIGDGNQPADNNLDSTVSAAVTAGDSGLFSAGPAISNFNKTAGTATLGFTLATNQSGTATITVTVTNTATTLTLTTTYVVTVNPVVVTTATASVATGNTVNLTDGAWTVNESGVTPVNLVYTVTTAPTHGTLYENGVGALGVNSTFSQQDVNFGLLYYVSTGSTSATDTIGFKVNDLTNGGSLSGQSLTINIIKPRAFTPGDLVVEQLGDSADPGGTSAATNVWLDEYTTAGALVQSFPLNDSTQNGDLAFTDSGKASTNGQMTLGPDGQDLALYAYNLNNGTTGATGVASETTAAIVGPNGVAEYEGFSNNADNNARSAVYDATHNKLYISGDTGTAYDGFTSGAVGQTAASIQPNNAGFTAIVNGQLYFSANAGGVFQIGTGEPTSGPVTPTVLPLQGGGGVDTAGASINLTSTTTYSGGSPLAFYFAHLGCCGPYINGENTLYVIDGNSGTGALLKYSYNGTAWVSEGAIAGPSLGNSTQLVGLTGFVSNDKVELYISEGNVGAGVAGGVFEYTDSSGSTGTLYNGATPGSLGSPIVNVGSANLPSSSVFANFRGVAFVPAALPSWVEPGSAATWDGTTLTVTGTAAIIADPGAASPLIVAHGAAAQLTIQPATVGFVNLGGITLTGGASITVQSVGACRTHTDHNVIVLDSNGTSVPTFSIDSASKLDLQDNDMIIQNGGSEVGTVQGLAQTGADYPNNDWTGNGLTSSVAESNDASQGYEQTLLAVVLNSSLPSGAFASWQAGSGTLALGPNDVVVKYTYNGDFNLDGMVNDSDAGLISAFYAPGAAYGAPGTAFEYGDTNGDGYVNDSDAGLFGVLIGLGTGGSNGNQL